MICIKKVKPRGGGPKYLIMQKEKIICFSTPFDETAVDMLEQVNCPIYKIASFEMTDYILLKKVAKTKKPIILSTGMATKKEIQGSIDVLKNGSKKIIILNVLVLIQHR